MSLKNDLILRTLRGEQTGRAPVWMMRQAGRILPEYRAIRDRMTDFKELIKNPELAAEVTIQPVDHLGVDAAIIFSDILVVPEAMGLPYQMIENKGPVFPKKIRSEKDLEKLRIFEPREELGYVLEAIKLTKAVLNDRVPLIGFAGAPWTIFAYMVEGAGGKVFSEAKRALYTAPAFSHKMLDMITENTIAYLKAQIAAGADLVQIFDSWAGILSPTFFREFSLKYIEKICRAIPEAPVIVFAKGASFALEEMSELPCQALGLDWNIEPAKARELTKGRKVLQGNLDPCALYASCDDIKAMTKTMLQEFGPQMHIANLGHGVYPDTDAGKARCFVDAVKEATNG